MDRLVAAGGADQNHRIVINNNTALQDVRTIDLSASTGASSSVVTLANAAYTGVSVATTQGTPTTKESVTFTFTQGLDAGQSVSIAGTTVTATQNGILIDHILNALANPGNSHTANGLVLTGDANPFTGWPVDWTPSGYSPDYSSDVFRLFNGVNGNVSDMPLVVSAASAVTHGVHVIGVVAGTNDLIGGEGNDTLTGGSVNDTITGGAGNDTIAGGLGIDRMTGGAGQNRFQQNQGDSAYLDEAGSTIANRTASGTLANGDILKFPNGQVDIVTDFDSTKDVLDASAVGANYTSGLLWQNYIRGQGHYARGTWDGAELFTIDYATGPDIFYFVSLNGANLAFNVFDIANGGIVLLGAATTGFGAADIV